jgi:hypothetical protein
MAKKVVLVNASQETIRTEPKEKVSKKSGKKVSVDWKIYRRMTIGLTRKQKHKIEDNAVERNVAMQRIIHEIINKYYELDENGE